VLNICCSSVVKIEKNDTDILTIKKRALIRANGNENKRAVEITEYA